jgi:hypothetical protein
VCIECARRIFAGAGRAATKLTLVVSDASVKALLERLSN